MAEGNTAFLWLVLVLLCYMWIRFLLRRILKRPVFEDFENMVNKFLPLDAEKWVRLFFDIVCWKR